MLSINDSVNANLDPNHVGYTIHKDVDSRIAVDVARVAFGGSLRRPRQALRDIAYYSSLRLQNKL